MAVRYDLKEHIQRVESAPASEGILDQREITVYCYKTTVPFDLGQVTASLATAWLSPTTRLGVFSQSPVSGDDGCTAVLGMQDRLTVRAYDYDERQPLWYSWTDVVVETASIRYYRGTDGKLCFITMGGARRITEDKLAEFNSLHLKIPPAAVKKQEFDLERLRGLCFGRFVNSLFMVRFKDPSAKEYESIDRAQFQSNEPIDPNAPRLHEVRMDNKVKIESFEAEIRMTSPDLAAPAVVRFLVRGPSGALRLRFPARLDLSNASQKPEKQAEAFYRLVNATRDSILDDTYYLETQKEWMVLHEQPDLFPVEVDTTAYRKMLGKPEFRETFIQKLNPFRPKHEWHAPLLVLNELMMQGAVREDVERLLGEKAPRQALEMARLLEECRGEPGLWRVGECTAAAVAMKLREIPAKERALAEGALLVWAAEREQAGWDVDPDTGDVSVLNWRGPLDSLTLGLRIKAVANLIGGVHARLTSDTGDVGILLRKFDWCVRAAKSLPEDHAECPAALRLIVEERVPKSPGDASKVLKNPVSDLAGVDDGVLNQFGLPMWPLLMAWRDNGKVFVRNTGIGSAQAMQVLGADTIAGDGGRVGVDLGPGKEAAFSIAGDTTALLAGFTKYGKTLSYLLPVAARRPSEAGAETAPADDRAMVAATLEAIHTDVRATHEIASRLPGAIANVEKGIETMQPHVRGIPKTMADLKEARLVPEAAALELFTKIQDVLTLEQQRIWTAVRNAGTQKVAVDRLRADNVILSEATLSRRVSEIDDILGKHDLPPCKAAGPRTRFKKSGGYEDDRGETVPEEVSQIDRDWAENPESRDSTIRVYLAASDEDKAAFHQTYYGIEDEAEEYKKRGGMKSD